MANLANLLTATTAEHGDRTAIILDDVRIDYNTLNGASAKLAQVLVDKGLQPGDRVGLMMPNVPHFAFVFFAVLRAGGVVVPMNPLLVGREVAFYLGDNGARWLFAWHGFAEAATSGAEQAGTECIVVEPNTLNELIADADPLAQVADREPDDTAVILYTSGTTGTPKGAELTHANLESNTLTCAETLFDLTADDVIFGGLPLFHVFGLTCGLSCAVSKGAAITLVPRFMPGKVIEVLARDNVTIFEGVPTMYVALNAAAAEGLPDLSSMRLAASGGAALPVEVLNSFEERFGVAILEGYGLSETSPVASFNHLQVGRKPGSIGTPIEGVQMRVVGEDGQELATDEVGEIQIKGPNIMKGYWGRPDATEAAIDDDGWFSSGDLARKDEDGFYFIVDRKKDMIIRGGYNVYPREVEEVLYEHPAIVEAAVLGVPHDEYGEEVAAAVVLNDGATVTADEIRDYVKEQVAAYKYPRKVWITDELPKTATGKIQKREITFPADVLA